MKERDHHLTELLPEETFLFLFLLLNGFKKQLLKMM